MAGSTFIERYGRLASLANDWILASSPETSLAIDAAAGYSLASPGKRIRPVLALACSELLGVNSEKVHSFCLALEYIHTFSLVHDDLPCMDNDLYRRGVPTCHVKYGEAIALLAGDSLLARAFTLLSDSAMPDSVVAGWTKLLSSAVVELCEGQCLDIQSFGMADGTRSDAQEKEALRLRHMKKTAALLRSAVLGPVFLAPEPMRADYSKALTEFGNQLGLLFQITDDLLEKLQPSEKLGKDCRSDERTGASTYVTVYGVEGASQIAAKTATSAKQALSLFGDRAEFLVQLTDYVLTRQS